MVPVCHGHFLQGVAETTGNRSWIEKPGLAKGTIVINACDIDRSILRVLFAKEMDEI